MSLVLLAEDDLRLAELVKDYLQSHGFDVIVEENGHQVLRRIRDLVPSMIILDINLPGKDGLTICREARSEFDGPILMLTARDSDFDQIKGLEFGADDYVIKPAEPRVLLARIKALLRRTAQPESMSSEDYVFGRLRIHLSSRCVYIDDKEMDLSSHDFDLLMAFARQPEKVLSREYLFNTVYRRPYDGLDRTIDVRVSQLRKRLSDNQETASGIKTVWGKGYLFLPQAWGAPH